MHEEMTAPSSKDEGLEKIYASIDTSSTRVQLDADKHTVWTENDTVFVISPDKGAYWVFDGATGDRAGSFSKVRELEMNGKTPADFGVTSHYAMYTYGSKVWVATNGSGETHFLGRVAQTQKYLKDSYGVHANVMFGTSSDGVNFSFVNIFAYLRFSLTGSRKVRSITLWENEYNSIAGRFAFPVSDPEGVFSYDEFSNQIVLDCGEEGVQLSDEPVDFYFALPPLTMTGGLGIIVEFTDGTTFSQKTSKEIVLERNTIQPFATLSTDSEEWQYLTIQHTGAQFSTPVFSGNTTLTGYIYCGDGNTLFLDNYNYLYEYTDGLQTHKVTARVKNADAIRFDSCRGVTKIDLSQF